MSDKPPPYPDATQPAPYPPQQPGYPPQPVPGPGFPPQPILQGQGYPQQPVGYAANTTTVIQQPTTVVIAPIPFFENPVSMHCPSCKATVVTGTQYVTGTMTWLACFGLCIIGCDLGCCFIPFCIDSMKDVIHICPNCQAQVGVFRRM